MEKPRVLVNSAKRGRSETEVLGEGPAVSPAELGSQPTERHRQATLSSVDIMVYQGTIKVLLGTIKVLLSDWVLLACDMGVAGTGLLVIRGGFSAFCGASEVDGGWETGVGCGGVGSWICATKGLLRGRAVC